MQHPYKPRIRGWLHLSVPSHGRVRGRRGAVHIGERGKGRMKSHTHLKPRMVL